MKNNTLNGSNPPLSDNRLILSDTTQAGAVQYRIWRDSQTLLVPVGQSTTRPTQAENVSANVGVFGEIREGYFQRPVVEFRNTTDFRLFDRFNLSVVRDFTGGGVDEAAYGNDGTELDLYDMTTLYLQFTFSVAFSGQVCLFPSIIRLNKDTPNMYSSGSIQYSTENQVTTLPDGNFCVEFSCDFLINQSRDNSILLGHFNNHNDNLLLDIYKARIIYGASEYIYNRRYNNNIPTLQVNLTSDILILGGTS